MRLFSEAMRPLLASGRWLLGQNFGVETCWFLSRAPGWLFGLRFRAAAV